MRSPISRHFLVVALVWALSKSVSVGAISTLSRQEGQRIVRVGGHGDLVRSGEHMGSPELSQKWDHQTHIAADDPGSMQGGTSSGVSPAGILDLSQDIWPYPGPDGVVCPTWVNPHIQTDNLEPFLQRTGVKPDGFIAEHLSLCGNSSMFPAATRYTGSWDGQYPLKNDVRVLAGLAAWARRQKEQGSSENVTWDQFSKPHHGMTVASLVSHLLKHPTAVVAAGTRRILDFGCGNGTDLVSMQAALNTNRLDTLCLDIIPVRRPEVYSILLDASSDFAYKRSLNDAAVGNENSIHVAVSMVTFHHIPRPQMRHDALQYIAQVLHPGGVFLMAEWDNSLFPSRWIHFDLVHILPTLLFQYVAPEDASFLKMGTQYLSVDRWIELAQAAGLEYDIARSKSSIGLGPKDAANQKGNANRDFHIVFKKH